MAVDVKFTKFDNTPWGFRLAGGSDFPHPLTVIKVLEGSLAECMGLKVGDVVVRLNDESISNLTHGEAHNALIRAGNNFVLGVKREEEFRKAVEAFSEDSFVPYHIPLSDLPPLYPEQILKEETVIERYEEETIEKIEQPFREHEIETAAKEEVEPVEKPKDADSEIVPNQNLTDDEIAQLILEEEELLPGQGVLGVNFKKLRPRATILKGSKVLEELQNIATEPPPREQQLRRTTTFLQKPQRPVPKQRNQEEGEEGPDIEGYRVVIKKQQKKTVTDRLLEKGLLQPTEQRATPETRSEATTPAATPDPGARSNQTSRAESRPQSKAEIEETSEIIEEVYLRSTVEAKEEYKQSEEIRIVVEETPKETPEKPVEPPQEELSSGIEKHMAKLASMVDREKIKQLVSTEISLEKQLENVQRQLLALKQLPSEIENHLRIVSEQLQKIMELSGVQNGGANGNGRGPPEDTKEYRDEERKEESKEEEPEEDATEDYDFTEDRSYSAFSDEPPRIMVPSDDESEDTETKELEGTISIRSNDDEGGSKVKKFIVSYETKVLKSREPSPATSYGSFEPDPKLTPKDQVIQELQQRKPKRGRKHSHDLWPQAKQLELTLGRRWRCPNDFFNDEMIAEVLCSQAEVIRGRALGINFKKYEKTNLPNYDHLMNSSVYKMIHKMEREPRKGIPARPAKVNAAEDIIERARSPALSVADDRSTRSVSH